MPTFEQAVRRGGLRKGQRVGWRRRQRAAGERIEQFAGCGFELGRVRHIVAEAHPRDLQAAAVAQGVDGKRWHLSGRIAEAGQVAARAQAGERPFPGRLTDRVVDHRHTGAAGEFANLRRPVVATAHEHRLVAVGQRGVDLVRRPDDADGVRAQRAQPLPGQGAHATRGGMKHHPVTGCDAVDAPHQHVHREPLEKRRRGGGVRDRVGQGHAARRRKVAGFAVGAHGLRRVGDSIAGAEFFDPGADGLDHADGLDAGHQGFGQGVQVCVVAAPAVHVGEIDADGGMADADFTGPGRSVRHGAHDQHLRSAEIGQRDFAAHYRFTPSMCGLQGAATSRRTSCFSISPRALPR